MKKLLVFVLLLASIAGLTGCGATGGASGGGGTGGGNSIPEKVVVSGKLQSPGGGTSLGTVSALTISDLYSVMFYQLKDDVTTTYEASITSANTFSIEIPSAGEYNIAYIAKNTKAVVMEIYVDDTCTMQFTNNTNLGELKITAVGSKAVLGAARPATITKKTLRSLEEVRSKIRTSSGGGSPSGSGTPTDNATPTDSAHGTPATNVPSSTPSIDLASAFVPSVNVASYDANHQVIRMTRATGDNTSTVYIFSLNGASYQITGIQHYRVNNGRITATVDTLFLAAGGEPSVVRIDGYLSFPTRLHQGHRETFFGRGISGANEFGSANIVDRVFQVEYGVTTENATFGTLTGVSALSLRQQSDSYVTWIHPIFGVVANSDGDSPPTNIQQEFTYIRVGSQEMGVKPDGFDEFLSVLNTVIDGDPQVMDLVPAPTISNN